MQVTYTPAHYTINGQSYTSEEKMGRYIADQPGFRVMSQIFEDTGYLQEGTAWVDMEYLYAKDRENGKELVFGVLSDFEDEEIVAFNTIHVIIADGEATADYGTVSDDDMYDYDDIGGMEEGMDQIQEEFDQWCSRLKSRDV